MMRRVWTSFVVLTAALAWPEIASACPVCFRFEESSTVSGIRVAVVVLVAVTTAVLGAFGTFVVRFARRAAAMSAVDDRSHP